MSVPPKISPIATVDPYDVPVAFGHGSGSVKLEKIDHVELYVGNSYQAAYYYRMALGFEVIGYSGPETGVRDRVSFALQQGSIRLLVTSATGPDHYVSQFVRTHGDGVGNIAFQVADAAEAFQTALRLGAKPSKEPCRVDDSDGSIASASVIVFGDTAHSFIERKGSSSAFLPHFRASHNGLRNDAGLTRIDHIALAVEAGKMTETAQMYRRIFGFDETSGENTATDYSAMNSRVVEDPAAELKVVIVEPCEGRRKSPIDEFLRYFGGSGVHHLALTCGDIAASVAKLRKNGLEFTHTPATYYDSVEGRVGPVKALRAFSELGILIDKDEWGYLMQIFSQPIQCRPTFFYEFIQRDGAKGFGSGNIKALFEAIERSQAARGNA